MQQTGERGEFFHPSLSPFGYNETVAQEYFPVIARRDDEAIHFAMDRHASLAMTDLITYGYHRSTYNADPTIPE
jgi:hypothetical protein